MRRLAWWMRIVGVLNLFSLGVALPPIAARQLAGMSQSVRAIQGTEAFDLLILASFAYGLVLGVIGLLLIVGARNPGRNLILVQAVLAMTLLHAVVLHTYAVARGLETTGEFIGCLVVDLLVLGTGIVVYPRGEQVGRQAP